MTPGSPKRMQPTPGSWTVEVGDNGHSRNSLDIVEDGEIVAPLIGDHSITPKMRRYARIISAAPELLESVLQLLEIVRDVPGQNAEIRVQYAEAAIRKARGE